jgi:hypothetical protein
MLMSLLRKEITDAKSREMIAGCSTDLAESAKKAGSLKGPFRQFRCFLVFNWLLHNNAV